jgi:hypothetical protein
VAPASTALPGNEEHMKMIKVLQEKIDNSVKTIAKLQEDKTSRQKKDKQIALLQKQIDKRDGKISESEAKYAELLEKTNHC